MPLSAADSTVGRSLEDPAAWSRQGAGHGLALAGDRSSRDAALSGAAAEVSRVGLARRRQVVP
jgi:hypothetical protein